MMLQVGRISFLNCLPFFIFTPFICFGDKIIKYRNDKKCHFVKKYKLGENYVYFPFHL